MTYSIGEVARMLGLTIYTLRYYDKKGLLPNLKRTPSGTRIFVDSDIDTLKVIECLKNTGVPIKEIKNFIVACQLLKGISAEITGMCFFTVNKQYCTANFTAVL